MLFGRRGLNHLSTSFFFYLRFIFLFGNLEGYLTTVFDGFNEFRYVNEKSKNRVVKCLIQSYVRQISDMQKISSFWLLEGYYERSRNLRLG